MHLQVLGCVGAGVAKCAGADLYGALGAVVASETEKYILALYSMYSLGLTIQNIRGSGEVKFNFETFQFIGRGGNRSAFIEPTSLC